MLALGLVSVRKAISREAYLFATMISPTQTITAKFVRSFAMGFFGRMIGKVLASLAWWEW